MTDLVHFPGSTSKFKGPAARINKAHFAVSVVDLGESTDAIKRSRELCAGKTIALRLEANRLGP